MVRLWSTTTAGAPVWGVLVHEPRDCVQLPSWDMGEVSGLRFHRSLGNFMVYHCQMSSLMAFVVSNPISLFYLAMAVVFYQTCPQFHLIDICNIICLILMIFLTANHTTSPPITTGAILRTFSPSPSTRTPPLPLTKFWITSVCEVRGYRAILSDMKSILESPRSLVRGVIPGADSRRFVLFSCHRTRPWFRCLNAVPGREARLPMTKQLMLQISSIHQRFLASICISGTHYSLVGGGPIPSLRNQLTSFPNQVHLEA